VSRKSLKFDLFEIELRSGASDFMVPVYQPIPFQMTSCVFWRTHRRMCCQVPFVNSIALKEKQQRMGLLYTKCCQLHRSFYSKKKRLTLPPQKYDFQSSYFQSYFVAQLWDADDLSPRKYLNLEGATFILERFVVKGSSFEKWSIYLELESKPRVRAQGPCHVSYPHTRIQSPSRRNWCKCRKQPRLQMQLQYFAVPSKEYGKFRQLFSSGVARAMRKLLNYYSVLFLSFRRGLLLDSGTQLKDQRFQSLLTNVWSNFPPNYVHHADNLREISTSEIKGINCGEPLGNVPF